MAIEDTYMENTGHYCEKCGNGDTNGRRVVKLKHGPQVMYLCLACMKGMVDWLEVPISYPQSQWSMSRADLVGWVVAGSKQGKPHADDLREEMSEWDKEMIDLGKDLMKIAIDRNNFYLAMRKKIKRLFEIVEEHLKKIG